MSLVSLHTHSLNKTFTRHLDWNRELLFVGGFLARAAYEWEMQEIKAHWDASMSSKTPGKLLDPGLRKFFYDRAGHNLRFFAFRESTPSPIVSSEMRSAFFDCVVQRHPFPVISSAGIKSALNVRMPDPALSGFLKKLPVFPEELLDTSKLIVADLQEKGMLRDIMFEDVLKELRERSLSEGETVACLQWWIEASQQDPAGTNDNRRQLLDAVRMTISPPGGGHERIMPLKGIQTFLPRNTIFPTDGPLPSHLLPTSVSQYFDAAQLQSSLQWRELTVLEWIQHIVDPAVYTQKSDFNIVEYPVWADRVPQVLGRCWPTLSVVSQVAIGGLLDKLTCIPTSAGMRTPSEAYFSSTDIFHDLPVVDLPSGVRIKGSLKGMLAGLGVRKHVELQVILDRWVPPLSVCPSHSTIVGWSRPATGLSRI